MKTEMKTKMIFKGVCGLIMIITLTSCGKSIEGKWVQPIPGMENEVQGVNLEKGGKASSINMATLQYEKWEKKGDTLLISGKSIGNNQTISFTDTLMLEELTESELTVKRYGMIDKFKRQY